jgi:hypothetical protein
MLFPIPWTGRHSMVRFTIRTDHGDQRITLDNSFKSFDVKPPASTTEDQMDVFIEFLNAAGVPDSGAIVLKTKARPRRGKPSCNSPT